MSGIAIRNINCGDTFSFMSFLEIEIFSKYTGWVQIIGRNLRLFNYLVTKTKKNTEKKMEDPKLTQDLSDSIHFASKLKE